MKYKIKVNAKEKELREYLRTEESMKDFAYCLANEINWDTFLKEKGLIKEETEYINIELSELKSLFGEINK